MHSGTPFHTLLIRRSAPLRSVIATFPHKGMLKRAVNRSAATVRVLQGDGPHFSLLPTQENHIKLVGTDVLGGPRS